MNPAAAAAAAAADTDTDLDDDAADAQAAGPSLLSADALQLAAQSADALQLAADPLPPSAAPRLQTTGPPPQITYPNPIHNANPNP